MDIVQLQEKISSKHVRRLILLNALCFLGSFLKRGTIGGLKNRPFSLEKAVHSRSQWTATGKCLNFAVRIKNELRSLACFMAYLRGIDNLSPTGIASRPAVWSSPNFHGSFNVCSLFTKIPRRYFQELWQVQSASYQFKLKLRKEPGHIAPRIVLWHRVNGRVNTESHC